MTRRSSVWTVLCATVAVLAMLGCAGSQQYDDAEDTPSTAGDLQTVLEVGPAARAVLASVDLADGAEDHVVSKCAVCALAMEGTAEHAVKVGDYEVQLCSDRCQEHFEGNAESVILALGPPEP